MIDIVDKYSISQLIIVVKTNKACINKTKSKLKKQNNISLTSQEHGFFTYVHKHTYLLCV